MPFVFALGVYVGQKDRVDIALYENVLMADILKSMSVYLAVNENDVGRVKSLTDENNLVALLKLLEQPGFAPDQEYVEAKVRTLNSLAVYWQARPPVNPFLTSKDSNAAVMSDEWQNNKNRIQKILDWAQQKCKSEPAMECRAPEELLK